MYPSLQTVLQYRIKMYGVSLQLTLLGLQPRLGNKALELKWFVPITGLQY